MRLGNMGAEHAVLKHYTYLTGLASWSIASLQNPHRNAVTEACLCGKLEIP